MSSVTPLAPLLLSDDRPLIERIYSIVLMREQHNALITEIPMKITDIKFGNAARAAQDAIQDGVAHGGAGRGHRRRDSHGHGTRRLRRSASHRRHHRRHAWLHHRGDPQIHRTATHRSGRRESQSHHAFDPNALEKNSSAKAAVEIAIYDLFGQLYGAPLYKLLGGGDPVVTTDITISVDYIDKMVADSVAAVERGFESLKIKVGKDIGVDLERIKAIYAAVEDRALLRLDANQGWTAKQAVFALQTLEDAGVRLELVEQPVKAQDLEGLKYVTERVHTPIMADESVFGPTQVIELIRMRAADIINIKLMKTGGISNAIHIADIAGMYEVECMIGCMLETSISVAAAVHLAVAKSNVITKVDLDGPSLCAFNPVDGGVVFNEAEISITDAPGLGIRNSRTRAHRKRAVGAGRRRCRRWSKSVRSAIRCRRSSAASRTSCSITHTCCATTRRSSSPMRSTSVSRVS